MARATSIISTSGTGVSLEALVAAVYLTAILAETNGPGDEQSEIVERVDFQRTEPVAGFDDLHVHKRAPISATTISYLQIKRTITGTRSDHAFQRPVADAAKLLSEGNHDDATFRIVTSQSGFTPRDVDRAKAAARLSSDSTEFWSRWLKPGASSGTEREYTEAITWVVEQTFGTVDADLAWRVICRIQIVELDVDQTGSQTIAHAIDRLQDALVSGDRAEALELFETLCQFALTAAKVAGGVDRSRLIAELTPRYKLKAAPSARSNLERLASDANAALASIRDDVAGVKLTREDLIGRVAAEFAHARGLRLGGEAGTGKSALLRAVAERQRNEGAGLLVLKHDRLTATSWSAHAQVLGLDISIQYLVAELPANGSGLLVLDGLDRIIESGFGDLVREICDAIESSPTASLWRCLVSSRDSAGPSPSLDTPFLRDLRSFSVGVPSPEELSQLAKAFPFLAPLLNRRGYAELNRNLFFIDQMARNPSNAGASSELDLMRAWAGRGSIETPRHLSRDSTLRSLGEQRLVRPYRPLPKTGDEDGLARLASERTVNLSSYRDVVTFAHDIYEEWAVARALDARREDIPKLLKAAGQPLAWMRPIRLVAEIALESDGPEGWRTFHDLLGNDAELDPLWRRLTLTAPLHSPRANNALKGLEPVLLAEQARLMQDMIETLLTLEVEPHPGVLSSPELDHLAQSERRQLAQELALPRLVPWYAFLKWSADRWAAWPKNLVPVLTRVTLAWLRLKIVGVEPTRKMVAQCVTWLRELDAIYAMSFDDWKERSQRLAEYGVERSGSADPVRDRLKTAIVNGAADAITDVDAYLGQVISKGDHQAAELVRNPGVLPTVLPERYVDLVVATMVMPYDPGKPLDYSLERSVGIRDEGGFFPASPTRAGFDLLFAADEDQALRLLDALTSAAATIWRRREERRGLTPRPLSFVLAGAEIQLWGDLHVFKWSSGLLGPYLLGSLLLAAEQWMFDQVASGKTVGEVCSRLLQSSHLVASASLCLAAAKQQATSLETFHQVLPLLAQPRLWDYDLKLHLDDRSGLAFQIGWRPGDEHAHRAALAVRERRARHLPLVESLIAPLHLFGDDELKEAFAASVATWSVDDLAAFGEELEDSEARARLQEQLDNFRAKADPSNWHFSGSFETGGIQVGYTPPDKPSERAAKAHEIHEEMEESGPLLDWAFGETKSGVTRSGQNFADALPFAKKLDCPDLFDHLADLDPVRTVRSQGVAAVAAAVATYGQADLVEAEREWLLSVLCRTAQIDHESNPIYFEETSLSYDPAASAARGLGALVMRGLADAKLTRIWLELVGSPFRDIAKAALEPAAMFATTNPKGCAAALAVSAASMLYTWHPFRENFQELMRASRRERLLRAIDLAVEAFDRGEFPGPVFPKPITSSFIAGDARNPCAGDPESQFDTYRASAVWKSFDIAAVCKVPKILEILAGYVSDALTWYASFMQFQDNDRSYGGPTRHMDWESTLGGMAGGLASFLPADVALAKLIHPAKSIPNEESRDDILANLLNTLGDAIVVRDLPIDAAFEKMWRAASQPLFERAHSHRSRRHDPDATPLTAAAFALYSMPVFPPNWPRANELANLIHEWVINCARYRFSASIIKTLIKQSGPAFMPLPGLDWLELILDAHKETSAEHWQSGMGSAAGEILVLLWSGSDKSAQRAHVARFRAAAARLADHGISMAAELLPEIAVVQANI
jgi:hypothetical protein